MMSLAKISQQLKLAESDLSALQQLTPEQQETLSQQLSRAKEIQHKHVKDAFFQAVDQLPRLMRKPILKMFEDLL